MDKKDQKPNEPPKTPKPEKSSASLKHEKSSKSSKSSKSQLRVTPITEEYSTKRIYIREDRLAITVMLVTSFVCWDMLTATSALQLHADDIRSSKMNWAKSHATQDLTPQEKDLMTKLDSVEGKKKMPETSPGQVADVLVGLLGHHTKQRLIQYALVMIDDIMSEDKTRVNLFKNGKALGALLHGLTSTDLFTEHMSGRIIAKLACWHKKPLEQHDRVVYFNWIKQRLTAEATVEGRSDYLNSVVRCLQMMLRQDTYRHTFTKFEGVPLLLNILSAKINFQVQYQVVFCLWVLTFNIELAEKVTHNPQFIHLLAETLAVAGKEKVTRILLALFRNLIEKPKNDKIIKEHCIALVQSKVLKQLLIVDQKGSDDEDFMSDLDFLINRLQASVRALSSFDQYVAEVKSGRLEWSPVHKSVQFWRENAIRIHEQPQLLRTIVRLLERSRDPVVLAVACYDIGEYVRHYPRGKCEMDQFGGKHRVMALLEHEDPNVRFEALLALQKIMVLNWEYLGMQLKKDQHEEKGKKHADTKESPAPKVEKKASKKKNK